MGPSQKLVWNLYAGAVAAVTAVLAQKALTATWKLATGSEPPDPNDPATPLDEAVIWALASGIGIGIGQLLVGRFAAKRFAAAMGTTAPKGRPIAFRI